MGYLDPFTTTASCYFPVDWMKGKPTLSHWMTSGQIKQKWTFLLHSRKKFKAPRSFLWNLLFHALVNYLKNASECTILNVSETKIPPPPILTCSRFKFQFSLFNTILLNSLQWGPNNTTNMFPYWLFVEQLSCVLNDILDIYSQNENTLIQDLQNRTSNNFLK